MNAVTALSSTTVVSGLSAKLAAVEADLNTILIDREEVIRIALCALISRQHLVVLGPPGTGKSFTITELVKRISDQSGTPMSIFRQLMHQFTKYEAIVGPPDVPAMKAGIDRYITTGRAPEAQVWFLDEVFKPSAAILNTLLTMMAERLFDNGGATQSVPLHSCFAASNELPQGDSVAAIWDRFTARVQVEWLGDADYERFMDRKRAGWTVPAPQAYLQYDELLLLQAARVQVTMPDTVFSAWLALRRDLAAKGWRYSDRRWEWAYELVQAHALICGRTQIAKSDLRVLKFCLWDRPEQVSEIARSLADLVSPLVADAVRIADECSAIYTKELPRINAATSSDDQISRASNPFSLIKRNHEQMKGLRVQLAADGEETADVDRLIAKVAQMRATLAGFLN